MSLSNLGYLAYKVQSSAATAVIPTHFMRFNEGDLTLDQENIVIESIQNNAFPTNVVKGGQEPSGEFSSDFDSNESPLIMIGALGTKVSSTDSSSATDASVFTHVIGYGASLPSYTFEQGRGNLTSTDSNSTGFEVRRCFGSQIDSFTLKGSSTDKLEFSWKLQALGAFQRAKVLADPAAGSNVAVAVDTVEGLVATDTVNLYDDTPQNEIDAIASISATNRTITIATLAGTFLTSKDAMFFLQPLTPSFSVAEQIFTMADVEYREGATYTAAAAATASCIENWELTYSNNLEARAGTCRRSRCVIAPRKRAVNLKFTKYFETRRDAERWLGAEQRGIELKITNNVRISATDTNVHKHTVTIALSNMRMLSHKMATKYGELYAYDVEMIGLYDATDTRAILITVKNGVAGTVYSA